jgi:hypothetical protein
MFDPHPIGGFYDKPRNYQEAMFHEACDELWTAMSPEFRSMEMN